MKLAIKSQDLYDTEEFDKNSMTGFDLKSKEVHFNEMNEIREQQN